VYHVDLFGRTTTNDSTKYDLNIGLKLREYLTAGDKPVPSLVKKQTTGLKCFNQADLPLNSPFKIQLTNVDTVKHFGIVLNDDKDRRNNFLHDFHKWHRENKKLLKPLAESTPTSSARSSIVGQACVVNSIQIGKWCRGLVTSWDSMVSVYLVDYCKSAQVSPNRLFRLEKKEFLEEAVYAHRCQLIEEAEQRVKFEKYLNLMKSDSFLEEKGNASRHDR